jgi:glycerol-1-phosphate dehydrogenase [NAD(P)+]
MKVSLSDLKNKFSSGDYPKGNMLKDFFKERFNEYLKELETTPNPSDKLLLKQKIKKLKEAYQKTFETDFYRHSIQLNQKLIRDDSLRYHVSDSVVAGSHIIEKTWTKIHRNSALITEAEPFEYIKTNIVNFPGDKINKIYFIEEIQTGQTLQNIINNIKNDRNIDMIAGAGGGRSMDILKFIGHQTYKTTVAFPTSLTSHVYASPKIHALKPIRELGYILTIDANPAHLSLLDVDLFEQLNSETPRLIRAGLGDIMAFYTARYDWLISIEEGLAKKNFFVEDVIDYILSTLEGINVEAPMSFWMRSYHLIQVLLCHVTDWVGSAPASGSEHLFALCVEEECENIPLHGELVALGCLVMSIIQKTNVGHVHRMLLKLGLPNSLSQIGISKDQAVRALLNARRRGREKKRFTIFEKIECSYDFFSKVIDELLLNGFIIP